MPVLLLVVMAVWWFGFRPIVHEQGWVSVSEKFALCGDRRPGRQHAKGCVVDGDTLVVGFGDAQRRIRLTGFDTPEIDGACDAERRLAETARRRLHQWLSEGPFEWDGGDEPPRDQYGRELRSVRRVLPDSGGDGIADGNRRHEMLADVMIAEGLAGQSGWGTVPTEWC